MLTTREAVESSFDPVDIGGARYWTFTFGDGYALNIEPTIFGQYLVALYQHDELLTREKVPFEARGEGVPLDLISTLIQEAAGGA